MTPEKFALLSDLIGRIYARRLARTEAIAQGREIVGSNTKYLESVYVALESAGVQ